MILAEAMTNLQMWDLIVGFFLPLPIAVAVQHHWSDQIRALVAFGASLIAAVGTVLIQSGWDAKNWLQSALIILVTTIATYKGLWTKVVPATHNGGGTN